MFALSHQFEIIKGVVEAISVSMMNYLALQQRATKMQLHNNAVFGAQTAFKPNVTVAQRLMDVAAFVTRVLVPTFARPEATKAHTLTLPLIISNRGTIDGLIFRGCHSVEIQMRPRYLPHFLATNSACHMPIVASTQHYGLVIGGA